MANLRVLLLLTILAATVFYKDLYAPFKRDDLGQIVNFPLVQSTENIRSLFFGGYAYIGEEPTIIRFYYKPIMTLTYAVLYSLGNGTPFVFHFLQIAIFVASCFLVFLFLKKFVTLRFAVLFSVLFLLSPVNMEVADYIASLQDTTFFFFGMLALLIAISNIKRVFKYSLTFFLLLLSMLSKETGVLFLITLPAYKYFFERKEIVWQLLISVGVTLVYLILRLISMGNIYNRLLDNQIHDDSLFQRAMVVASSIRFYIQEMLVPGGFDFPKETASQISLQYGLVSVVVILVFGVMIAVAGQLLRFKDKKKLKPYIFFILWMFLGILFHSQIVTLDVFAAKRWMLFSMVGLMGALAIILSTYWRGTRQQKLIFCSILFVILVSYIQQHFLPKV